MSRTAFRTKSGVGQSVSVIQCRSIDNVTVAARLSPAPYLGSQILIDCVATNIPAVVPSLQSHS